MLWCIPDVDPELSPRSVSQVEDAENVFAEVVAVATTVLQGLGSRETILERQTNRQMRNQMLIPKSSVPIPTARYMVCLCAYSDAVSQPRIDVPPVDSPAAPHRSGIISPLELTGRHVVAIGDNVVGGCCR